MPDHPFIVAISYPVPVPLDPETIAAISTPPGRGGIGIVRLSGTLARSIVQPLFRLARPLAPGRARFAELLDEHGHVLDQAIVTLFASPRSYTGEDVIELALHGAPVLLEYLLRACIARGARLAEPGEFTQRAFLAGRLDLTQAEAVADLIDAQTLAQARIAAAQLGGSLSHAIGPVKAQLIELIAALEAGVDFAEDDLDLMEQPELAARLNAIRSTLAGLAATWQHGRILREGFRLAIVGRPNSGKSSLFNRLLQRERAIVTSVPGTTRDPIAERLAIDGVPVELIDTAGLRHLPSTSSADPHTQIEAEGIRRTRSTMAEAELVLLVVDASQLSAGLLPEDRETLRSLHGRPYLTVLNKSDLPGALPQLPVPDDDTDLSSLLAALPVSALTGQGLEQLRSAIRSTLTGPALQDDQPVITNLRQHQQIQAALEASQKAHAATLEALPHEFVLLDLYACLTALDSLTGATTPDDILHRIFASFCIGK